MLRAFQHKTLQYDARTADYYRPFSTRVLMDGALVAQFGQIHPDIAAARKLRQSVFIAELYLDRLYVQGLERSDISRCPAIRRWSGISRLSLTMQSPSRRFTRLSWSSAWLSCAALFRRKFFGEATFPGGKYSVLLRARLQSSERTLREDEVAQWSAQVIKALEGLGGKLRA